MRKPGFGQGDSILATVHGSKSATGSFINVSYGGKTAPAYIIKNNQGYYMTNYLREAQYYYANILLDGRYTAYLYVYGWWSPDSDVY